jgi:hypothetical protein
MTYNRGDRGLFVEGLNMSHLRTNKSWLSAATVLACALAISCGTTLWQGRMAHGTDDWTFEISEYKDGPNSWTRPDNTTFKPADGERFLWVKLKIRNNSQRPRSLNVQTCSLDLDGNAALPGLALYDGIVVGQVDLQKNFDPGEVIERKLAWSYPQDRWPHRLTCAGVDFPLPGPSK